MELNVNERGPATMNNVNGDPIFLSHSSEDNDFACRLYEHLQSARYWVWMDKYNIRAGKKWEPQIDENLRKSKIFIFLMSQPAAESEWVRHEGSMALALNRKLITVRFRPGEKYGSYKLPLWARPIQPINLFEGTAEYPDQLEELAQLLGKPLPIREYLLNTLPHFQASGQLLDEGALELVEQHFAELHLKGAQKRLAIELIRESRSRLDSYWIRHKKLKDAYDLARTENLSGKLKNKEQESAIILRQILLVFYAAAILILFFAVLYLSYLLWLQSHV